MKINGNLISGIGLLSLTIYWLSMTGELPAGPSTNLYGPDFFPKMISSALGICSVALIWLGLKDLIQKKAVKVQGKEVGKVVLFILAIIAYVYAFELVGFVISSIVFLVFAQFMFGIRKNMTMFVISPIAIIVINLIFANVFQIPLP